MAYWTAYHSGFKAQLNGFTLAHNPYESLSKLWYAWQDGWMSAVNPDWLEGAREVA